MTCPHCSSQVRDGAQFCMDCGFYIPPPPGRQREAAVMTATFATAELRTIGAEIEPGSLMFRFIAAMLDSALLVGVCAAIVVAFMRARGDELDLQAFVAAGERLSLLLLVLQIAYWAGFETSRLHATPGKLLFGLAVTDADGEGLALPHAACRWLVKSLIGTFFPVGYFFAIFTAKKQTLYDLMVGTAVIER